MQFEELMKEVKKQNEYASLNLAKIEAHLVPIMKERKKTATGKLEDLFKQYKQSIGSRLVFVLAYSKDSSSKEFADKLKELDDLTRVANALEMVDTVANKVDPRLYKTPQSNRAVLDVLNNVIEGVAAEIDVSSYPMALYDTSLQGMVRNKNDLKKLTQKVLVEKIGTDMLAVYVTNQVARSAFDDSIGGPIIPVVVYLENDTLAADILSGLRTISINSFAVAVGKETNDNVADAIVNEVTEESILEAMNKIRKQIKKGDKNV